MTDPFASEGSKAPPKPFTVEEGRRRVRSFVLRQGRFTPAQQRAFDDLWPRLGLDFTGQPRDFDAVFGRDATRVRETGSGNGAAWGFPAARDRDRDHNGSKVQAPCAGALIEELQEDARDPVGP